SIAPPLLPSFLLRQPLSPPRLLHLASPSPRAPAHSPAYTLRARVLLAATHSLLLAHRRRGPSAGGHGRNRGPPSPRLWHAATGQGGAHGRRRLPPRRRIHLRYRRRVVQPDPSRHPPPLPHPTATSSAPPAPLPPPPPPPPSRLSSIGARDSAARGSARTGRSPGRGGEGVRRPPVAHGFSAGQTQTRLAPLERRMAARMSG
ncbi:unnamed protein product, partial [Urochloa humidicola]